MTTKIILYGNSTCPQVPPVREALRKARVEFEYIDIQADAEALARVRALNNGNASVPTCLFPDGTTLTEPSTADLQAKLKSLGHKTGLWARLINRA